MGNTGKTFNRNSSYAAGHVPQANPLYVNTYNINDGSAMGQVNPAGIPNAPIGGYSPGTASTPITPVEQEGNGYMPYVAAGLGAIQTGIEIGQDYNQTNKFNVDEATMNDKYNPYYQPPAFMKQQTPEEISEGTGKRAALNYGMKGASTGASIGTLIAPGVGTLIGAGVGAAAGGVVGAFKGRRAEDLRAEWEQNQKDRFNKYLQADRIHGDVTGTHDRAMAKAKSFSERGINSTPIYNSHVYGFTR